MAQSFPIWCLFNVILSESRHIFALGVLLVLATRFPYYLLIWLFCYNFKVPIFCFKIVLPHSVVGKSLHIYPLPAGRIFFNRFGMSSFVCIIWPYLGILWPFFFHQYLLEFYHFFKSCCAALFVPTYFRVFLVIIFLLIIKAFLFLFSVWFLIQFLNACLCSLEEPYFFID